MEKNNRPLPPSCPQCGSTDTIHIIWGYPGPELLRQEANGEIWLGGCTLHGSEKKMI
jgi:hypothetical protein